MNPFCWLILKHATWHNKSTSSCEALCRETQRFFSTYFPFTSNHCLDMLLLRCLRKQTNKHAEYSDCATFRNIFMTGIKDLKKKKKSQLSQYMFQCMCMIFLSHRLMFMSFSNISQSVYASKFLCIIKIISTWIKISRENLRIKKWWIVKEKCLYMVLAL